MEEMYDDNQLYEAVSKASKKGAVEDIIHVSKHDDGYDLRNANLAIGEKQPFDENGNA